MSSDRYLEIAKRAHEIWDASGRPDGHAEQHWLRAERELAAVNDNGASLRQADVVLPVGAASAANGKAPKAAAPRKPSGSKKAPSAGRAKRAAVA